VVTTYDETPCTPTLHELGLLKLDVVAAPLGDQVCASRRACCQVQLQHAPDLLVGAALGRRAARQRLADTAAQHDDRKRAEGATAGWFMR
jgi:hypothetical protein